MTLTLGMLFLNVLVAQLHCNWKAPSENWKASFEEVEGFLQRVLSLYACKECLVCVCKSCTALLRGMLGPHLCLAELGLQQKCGAVKQVVSTMHTIHVGHA